MRRASKIDRNQPEIVDALRRAGASVQPLHSVGQGCPDLAVGFRGQTYLIETKDGSLPPSRRKLTPAQTEWHAAWRGHVAVAKNISEALDAIGLSPVSAGPSTAAQGVAPSAHPLSPEGSTQAGAYNPPSECRANNAARAREARKKRALDAAAYAALAGEMATEAPK